MIQFFFSTASASTSSHLALVEAEIPFKGIEVSWSREMNLRELKEANPFEAVPTLVSAEGKVLTQNPAILEFIADFAPAKKLLPAHGTWERREIQSWLSFLTADFQRSFLPLGEADEMTSSEEAREEVRQSALERIAEGLDHIEQSLKGKEYLVGGSYSLADIHLYCCLNWCEWFEISFGKYPGIQAFRARVLKRPAVQKVMSEEGLI
jgi:glutathione S-transferase